MSEPVERRLSRLAEDVLDAYLRETRERILIEASAIHQGQTDDINVEQVAQAIAALSLDNERALPVESASEGTQSADGASTIRFTSTVRRSSLLRRLLLVYSVFGALGAFFSILLTATWPDSKPAQADSFGFVATATFAAFSFIAGASLYYFNQRDKIRVVERMKLESDLGAPKLQSLEFTLDPVGNFLRTWSSLEAVARTKSAKSATEPAKIGLRGMINEFRVSGQLSEYDADEFFSLLGMRNDLVHGVERFDDAQLAEATARVRRLIRRFTATHAAK